MHSMVVPHERVYANLSGKSMTKQEFSKESNINRIMAKYLKTGLVEHVRTFQGQYGNFLSAPDYHKAMSQVVAAQQMFEGMPSNIRNKFDNDPEKFLAFVQDYDNTDEMRELGLLPKEALTAPQETAQDGNPEPGPETEPEPPAPEPAPEPA